MNMNRELHELLGKCWHEHSRPKEYRDGFGYKVQWICEKCGNDELNPDYTDARLVLEAMREREPFVYDEFVFWLLDQLAEKVVMSKFFGLLDLILDRTGRLRDLAIEWLREGR